MEEESAFRVARSVVSGFLLRRFEKRQIFTPIHSKTIMDYLKDDGLLAPFEKRALLEAGLQARPRPPWVFDDHDREEREIIVSALNFALLCIESDTKAVKCMLMDNLNGVYEDIVYVLSIQPNLLVNELLLPFAFHLGDLALSPVELFPSLEDQPAIQLQRLKALRDE